MNYIKEKVLLTTFMEKLQYFIKREDIKLQPDFIKSMDKVDSSTLQSFVDTQVITIITEQASPFTHLSSARIIGVYPTESIYILLYIVKIFGATDSKVTKNLQPYTALLQKEIHLHIYDQAADQSFRENNFLCLLTSISIFGDRLKMDIPKIDNHYSIDKNKISGTQKSPTGTFFQKQSTKYFIPKYNPNPGSYIPIEELRTKQKDYLKGAIDRIIVVHCPVCGNKHKRNYFNIKDLFSISGSTVTLSCNHSDSIHMYESKPYSFRTDSELSKKYKKLEIIMFIINNKDYYDLSKNK